MSLTTAVTGPPGTTEIQVPFTIDTTTGGVMAMADAVQTAIQHIMSILLTVPGERIHNPTYGVGIQNLVFENSDSLDFQAAAMDAQNQLSQSDGTAFNVTISVVQNPMTPGTFVFQVGFTVYNDPQVHLVLFDYQGNVIGES